MIGRTRMALKQPQEPMEISDLDDLVDPSLWHVLLNANPSLGFCSTSSFHVTTSSCNRCSGMAKIAYSLYHSTSVSCIVLLITFFRVLG